MKVIPLIAGRTAEALPLQVRQEIALLGWQLLRVGDAPGLSHFFIFEFRILPLLGFAFAMSENIPPNGTTNGDLTRGLPYYEKLRKDTRETLQKKRLLDKNIVGLQCLLATSILHLFKPFSFYGPAQPPDRLLSPFKPQP